MNSIMFTGDWIKDKILGSGSFGLVVLWKHQKSDVELVLKSCKWGDELTERQKERWTNEVDFLRECTHPNIVSTVDLSTEFIKGLIDINPCKLPILCMEYCTGGDLRHILNKPMSCSGLKEFEIRKVIHDLSNALQYLHSIKLCHRDLKPENIVMQELDTVAFDQSACGIQKRKVYKIIDLGFAKEFDSNSPCCSISGTLHYLAPEIICSKTYNNSVDYWSLGIITFEIICGLRPFLPHMAPVQWMPHVKKKASKDICVFETFHGDIEYSDKLFPESHISSPFKNYIERWLCLALEWDTKLRGRDVPSKVTFNLDHEEKEISSNIILFKELQVLLAKKILKIFSVVSMSSIEYEIDDATTIASIKKKMLNDLKIPIKNHVVLCPKTYCTVNDSDMASRYWSEHCEIMLYLFDKEQFLCNNIDTKIPKAVQRAIEHPKTSYNFNNSQELYRCVNYFVLNEKCIFDSLLSGVLVRMESLKNESKQMLLKHNNVACSVNKLVAKYETVAQMVSTGKKHVQALKENCVGTNFLGGFDDIFTKCDGLTDKIIKIQSAWNQLSTRLQSAARRSNDILAKHHLNVFVSKYNFESCLKAAQNAYIYYKTIEKEFRSKERYCHDIIKASSNCLKLKNKIIQEIQHQPFIMQIMDLSIEFSKISEIIHTASESSEKLYENLGLILHDLTNCVWSTISMLSHDAENLADLPYSVISFEKRDFKIGEAVSKNHGPMINGKDTDLKTLLEENIRIRKSQSQLSEKLQIQKKMLNDAINDFKYLHEKQ